MFNDEDWDLGTCLKNECYRKQLRVPHPLRSWIDLRATYKVCIVQWCLRDKFTASSSLKIVVQEIYNNILKLGVSKLENYYLQSSRGSLFC